MSFQQPIYRCNNFTIECYRQAYVNLELLAVNSIVFTGGITKVLGIDEIETIIAFFYRKILASDHRPVAILDSDYVIWTLGIKV